MEKQALGQAISSVAAFILLALPGYIFTRKKWLTGRQVEGLSSVLVNYLWRVMVLDAMARTQRSAELAKLAAGAGVWALAVILLGGVCAWIWTKAGKMKQVPGNILVFAAAFANTGLIGMPLIRLLLGQEALSGGYYGGGERCSDLHGGNPADSIRLRVQAAGSAGRAAVSGTGGGGSGAAAVCVGPDAAGSAAGCA